MIVKIMFTMVWFKKSELLNALTVEDERKLQNSNHTSTSRRHDSELSLERNTKNRYIDTECALAIGIKLRTT